MKQITIKSVDDDDEDGDVSGASGVEVVGKSIYFYTEINRESSFAFNKELRKLDYSNARLLEPKVIKIYCQSNGGSLFASLSMYDVIRNCKSEIHFIIDGSAASGATIMLMGANQRFINKNAYILIHQLSGGMWGKFSEMKDEFESSQDMMSTLKEIYKKHTKLSDKDLKELLNRDLWLNAKKAKKLGLVDEII